MSYSDDIFKLTMITPMVFGIKTIFKLRLPVILRCNT